MKLAYLFVILLLLQLGTVAAALWGSVYLLEGLVVADIAYLIFFYRRTMRPINRLGGGLDLLRAQDWNTRIRHVGQPEVDRIADVFNDMLERLKNQRIRYRERTHLLNLLVEAAPVGVIILGFDGRASLTNPAATALLDSTPGLQPFLDSLAVGGNEDLYTSSGETLRCSCRSFLDRGVSHRFYIVENISNSVAAAERGAYEKVIRIIAHEVNNTVAGLTSALDAIAPLPGSDSDDMAAVLGSCSERASALSAFISRFAEVVRLPEAILRPADINDIISRCSPFLQSIGATAGVRVDICCAPEVPTAMVDATLLEQALVNIVKNAVESTSDVHGTEPVRVTTGTADGHAIIEVADRGEGISPEKSRLIFTPFYTDKPMGQGVGLMLVRDILRRHGARFALSTTDGVTVFRIEFT